MTQPVSPQGIPTRDAHHDALEVFIGEWSGEGQAFGSPDQDPRDPRGRPVKWTSKHLAHWHTGRFFLIQEERAQVDGPFDTLGVMGWDAGTARYFARTFENHGYYRHYEVAPSGRVWTFSGATERARIEFSSDGSQQTINWEWRPHDIWLPLCDRVATRIGT